MNARLLVGPGPGSPLRFNGGKLFAASQGMQRAFIAGCLLGCLGLVGCFDERRPAQSADDYEYDDQAEYGSTPTHGPGSEEQGGYYGVGSAEPPSHQPATPSGGGHQPY